MVGFQFHLSSHRTTHGRYFSIKVITTVFSFKGYTHIGTLSSLSYMISTPLCFAIHSIRYLGSSEFFNKNEWLKQLPLVKKWPRSQRAEHIQKDWEELEFKYATRMEMYFSTKVESPTRIDEGCFHIHLETGHCRIFHFICRLIVQCSHIVFHSICWAFGIFRYTHSIQKYLQ